MLLQRPLYFPMRRPLLSPFLDLRSDAGSSVTSQHRVHPEWSKLQAGFVGKVYSLQQVPFKFRNKKTGRWVYGMAINDSGCIVSTMAQSLVLRGDLPYTSRNTTFSVVQGREITTEVWDTSFEIFSVDESFSMTIDCEAMSRPLAHLSYLGGNHSSMPIRNSRMLCYTLAQTRWRTSSSPCSSETMHPC